MIYHDKNWKNRFKSVLFSTSFFLNMDKESVLGIKINPKGAIIPTIIKELKSILIDEDDKKQVTLFGQVVEVRENNLQVIYKLSDLNESIEVSEFMDDNYIQYQVGDNIFVSFTYYKQPFYCFNSRKVNNEKETQLHLKLFEKSKEFLLQEQIFKEEINSSFIDFFKKACNQTVTRSELIEAFKEKYSINTITNEIDNLINKGIIHQSIPNEFILSD